MLGMSQKQSPMSRVNVGPFFELRKKSQLKKSELRKIGQTNFSDASASFVCPFLSGRSGVQSKIMSQGGVETEFVFETAAFQF